MQGGFAFASDTFGFNGVPVVQMGELRRGVLDLSNVKRIAEEHVVERFSLKQGDILLGLSGSIGETGSLGNFAQVRAEDLPAQLNQRLGRFMPHAEHAVPRYLFWLIQSRTFIDQLLVDCTGTAQFNISTKDIEVLLVPNATRAEQTAIANYLDAKASAIDSLIAKKELLIEELKKYQEAMIAEAVKPREGWTKKKVKGIVRALPKSSRAAGEAVESGAYPFYVSGQQVKTCETPEYVDAEAVVLATGGGPAVHHAIGSFAFSTDCWALVAKPGGHTGFLYHLLTGIKEALGEVGFRGAGIKHLDKDWLLNLDVEVPTYEEQAAIATALDERIAVIRKLVENAEAAVREGRRLRAALISEAVTGKLKLPS